MSHTDRIFRMEQLLRERTVVSRRTFLDELEISLAQFKRDLAFLRDQFQLPIEYDSQRNGYFIARDSKTPEISLPGPMYTIQEIHALLVIQDLINQLQSGLLDEHLGPMRERLKLLLGGEDLRSEEIRRRIRILHMASRPVAPKNFQRVSEATLTRKRIHIRYYSRDRDDLTERDVSPQRLVFYRGNWYLDAWCHLREDLRSFAVDAMEDVSVLAESAQDIATEALDAHLGAGYGIFAGIADKQAVLRFEPWAARYVGAERWHANQTQEVEPSGHLLLTVPYANEPELIMDIMRYGPDVEVIAPIELKQKVKDRLSEAIAKY
jgi:predicted DNA-binding transcriptional regulator YafY